VRFFSCPFPAVASFNTSSSNRYDYTASLLNSKFDATYLATTSSSSTLRIDSTSNYNYVIPTAGMRLVGPGATWGDNSYISSVTVTPPSTYYLPPSYTITVTPALTSAAIGSYFSTSSANNNNLRGGGASADKVANYGIWKWKYYNSYSLTGGCLSQGYAKQTSLLLASASSLASSVPTATPPQNTLFQAPPTSSYSNTLSTLTASTVVSSPTPDAVSPLSWTAQTYGFLAKSDGSTLCASTDSQCYLYVTNSQGVYSKYSPSYISGVLGLGMGLKAYSTSSGGTQVNLGPTLSTSDPAYYSYNYGARADNGNLVTVVSATTSNGLGGTQQDALCTSVCGPFLLNGFSSPSTSYKAPIAASAPSSYTTIGTSNYTSADTTAILSSCTYARAVTQGTPCVFYFQTVLPSTTTRAGYPISVARIGGAGWRDVYISTTLQSYGTSNTGNYPKAFSQWMNSKFLSSYTCTLGSSCTANGFKAKEFIAQSWEDIPKAVAFTTEQPTVVSGPTDTFSVSPHMSQVYWATGRKACNTTSTNGCPALVNNINLNMAGSIIGRCWYGESASTLLSKAPIAPKCSDTLFTTVDPTNAWGTAGLCYTSHTSSSVESRLLMMRAKSTGAIASWPVSTYKTYTWNYLDETYVPGLDNGISAFCYGNAATVSRTFSSSSDSLNSQCLTSIYNPYNPNYLSGSSKSFYTFYNIDKDNGNAGSSTTGVTSNLRNCAARTSSAANSVDFFAGSPSFTFWVERSATGGYAVQRSDYETISTTTQFTASKPLWPATGNAKSSNTYGQFVDATNAASPDTNVVGVAYFASSVSSGLLYVATTTALYGSYNPLAPYYVDRRNAAVTSNQNFISALPSTICPSVTALKSGSTLDKTQDSDSRCFVQWHKLVYLGNGGGGYNSATGNLGFPTNPAIVNGVTVNSFRGIALAPRACTYSYQTTQLNFRELEEAEEEEEEENAA